MPKPSNAAVLHAITTKLLGHAARRAIVACARRGYGAARNLAAILDAAKQFGARPRAVAAAFGFLPDFRQPRSYVDVLANDDECALGMLPRDAEVAAAFALSRAVHPEGGSFVVG